MKYVGRPTRLVRTFIAGALIASGFSGIIASSAQAQAAAVLRLTKTPIGSPKTNNYRGVSPKWRLDYSCVSVTVACANVQITDVLPPGVTYVSSTGGGGPVTGGAVWNLGTLSAGTTGSVQITGYVPCSTGTATFNNSATITSTGLVDVQKTSGFTVNGASTCAAPPPPGFGKSGPSVLSQGGRLNYGLTLPAKDVEYEVVDILPVGMQFINTSSAALITVTMSCDNGVSYVPSCTNPQRVKFLVPVETDLRWRTQSNGDINWAAGAIQMRVPVTTPIGTTVTNNAVGTSTSGATPGTQVAAGSTSGNVVGPVPMTAISKSLTKDPGVKSPPAAIDDVGYSITYNNAGGLNAAGADLEAPIITDLLDPNTQWIDGENTYTVSSDSTDPDCATATFSTVADFNGTGRTLLRWSFPNCALAHDLDTNPGITINFTARMKPGVAAGTTIANNATGQENAGTPAYLCDNGLIADSPSVDGDANTTEKRCDAPLSFEMPKLAVLDSSKWVNGAADLATDWSRYPDEGKTAILADGFSEFRVFLRSTSNVDSKRIELVDVLPYVGDSAVSEASLPRSSEWGMQLAGPLKVEFLPYENLTGPVTDLNLLTGWTTLAKGTDYTESFSQDRNPCRVDGNSQIKYGAPATAPSGCVNDWGSNDAGAKAFALDLTKTMRKYDPTKGSGDIIRITVLAKESGNAAADSGKIAWNSFAYTFTDTTDQEFLTAEPIKVGVRMSNDPPTRPSLGDYLWYDENNDGIQDPLEEGIDGVQVSLYDTAGNLIRRTLTGTDPADASKHGYYRFDVLGDTTSYKIVLDRPADAATGGPLAGFVLSPADAGADTADSDAILDSGRPTIAAALTGAGATHTPTYDIGVWKKPDYSIGNRVWLDEDNSGAMDSGEAGVDNVVVNLFRKNTDGSLTKLTSDTTKNGGYYRFDGLDAGDYVVQIDPSNFAFGGPLAGRRSSTGGAQEADANSNGDRNDNGLDPATLADYSAAGDTKGVLSSMVTVGPNLVEPSGETDLSPTGQGAVDRRANMTVDFGFHTPKFAVGNRVWIDTDNDGIQDTTEVGINGVTVTVYRADGSVAGTTTTVVGPDGLPGFYLVDDLVAGDYTVGFTDIPAGYVLTKSVQGSDRTTDSDANATTGLTGSFTLNEEITPAVNATTDGTGLKASYVLRDIDAGIGRRYSLGNNVWHDINGNSLLDSGEAGIDGVTVELYRAGPDGNPAGPRVALDTTSSGGSYLFTGLLAGDYVVVIPASNFSGTGVLTGFYSSGTTSTGETTAMTGNSDLDTEDKGTKDLAGNVKSSVVTLGPAATEPTAETATAGRTDTTPDDQSNLTVDFGFLTMSLGNLVWEDTDNDGTRNGTEPVIAGVAVRLYRDDNADGIPDGNEIASTLTNADGQYLFTSLTPGKYVVEILPPAGFYSSSGTSGSYSGPYEPGVGDNIGADTLDHGTTVGNFIRSTTIVLSPGTEPTTSVEADGLSGLLANQAVDTNTDLTVDFGLVPGASIGNYVWLDNNRDGIQNDAADAGIDGVTVKLVDQSGNVIKTTVTSAGPDGKPGFYRFDVIPGNFRVVFDLSTLPPGFAVSPKDAGTNDALDSDVDPATGSTAITLLDPNENDPNWDLGVYPTAVAVGNFVWLDYNGDGIQNDGPTAGFPGVKVTLLDASGQPVTKDVQGNTINPTQVTDQAGQYLFSNLKAGVYKVRFELPNGYIATTTGVGTTTEDSNGVLTTSRNIPPGQADLTLDLGLVANLTAYTEWPALPTPPAETTTVPPAGSPPGSGSTVPAGPTTAAPPAALGAPTVPTVPSVPSVPTVPTSTPAGAPTTIAPASSTPTAAGNEVTGTVYIDGDRSTTKGKKEEGRPGVTVNLLDSTGKVVATTTSDGNGNYSFSVPPGDYVVEIMVPGDSEVTTSVSQPITVAANGSQKAADFGLAINADALAFTGPRNDGLTTLGASMVLAGALLLLQGRKRRRKA